MRACLFPGQGSQFIGMGEGLFERYPEMTAAADEILGYPLEELCLRDREGRLQRTQYAQPALYVVNALSYRSRCDGGAPPPDFLAGHSLGEYNALWAAGVFDFETGLRLVKRRGELMGQAAGGGMAAVMGCDGDRAEELLRSHDLLELDVANFNSPSQVVLSGPAEALARAEALFTDLGATWIPLKNVSAAFHSRYMESVVAPLGEALADLELRPPEIPVVANVTALPYDGNVRELLMRQIREPVRWTETVRYLLRRGVRQLEEVGPGEVLAKLVRTIRRQSAAELLGSVSFRRGYGVRKACAAGALSHGIASVDLVVRMGRAGYLGFLGAGGLAVPQIDEQLRSIRTALRSGEPFGVSLSPRPDDPESAMAVVDLCLKHGVRFLETAGSVTSSAALVRFRLKAGESHRVMARVSRPDVAERFLGPPPPQLVEELLRAGLVSEEEAQRAGGMPMADDLCVEPDPGLGGTEVLLPLIRHLRDEICGRQAYVREVHVGCGGIGTPEAAAAAFLLGADFLVTVAVNQCTVEAGTSAEVKDLLQVINVQDTDLAPDADLFELGGRVQVLKRGVLFPARANRLYDLWRCHGGWEEIDAPTRTKVERDIFGRGFGQVWEELERTLAPAEAEKGRRDPRHRMALVFRWYLGRSLHLAVSGEKGQQSNYQVPCSPALGAFNQRVKGTRLESWRRRHVDLVADEILAGAAELLERFRTLAS